MKASKTFNSINCINTYYLNTYFLRHTYLLSYNIVWIGSYLNSCNMLILNKKD